MYPVNVAVPDRRLLISISALCTQLYLLLLVSIAKRHHTLFPPEPMTQFTPSSERW